MKGALGCSLRRSRSVLAADTLWVSEIGKMNFTCPMPRLLSFCENIHFTADVLR